MLSPFYKRVYSKWKEFAPKGSKFLALRVDSFSEGKEHFDRVFSPEGVSFSLKSPFAKIGYFALFSLVIIDGQGKAKKCLRACAKCVDSHHPGHVQNIILAFALHSCIMLPMILLADSEGPDRSVWMGRTKQNVLIHIILGMLNVLSGPLFSIHTFVCIQLFC